MKSKLLSTETVNEKVKTRQVIGYVKVKYVKTLLTKIVPLLICNLRYSYFGFPQYT